MDDAAHPVWIHAGACPVCEAGLRRVRACYGDSRTAAAPHGYVICDECEALWLTPDPQSPRFYPDTEQPACPVCQGPLFGSQAHYATVEEVRQLGWQTKCRIESSSAGGETSDLLEPEDVAIDLDAVPPPLETGAAILLANSLDAAEHLAQADPQIDSGSDDEEAEPRPGC
jgi:uncharacterized protein YbaR (Trm112 family)